MPLTKAQQVMGKTVTRRLERIEKMSIPTPGSMQRSVDKK
jgi:hypothetical protein